MDVTTDRVPEETKPNCELIGQDGNAFNLIAIVRRTLRDAGLADMASQFTDEAKQCKSYDDLLCLISCYVNVTGDEDEEGEE